MTIVAVIPAYNEEVAIGSMIARARAHVDEVLVIDDGSHDATSSIAKLMGATVIIHEKNAGKGAALKTAFLWALARDVRILVTLDADGSTFNPVKHGLGVLNSIVWDMFQTKVMSKKYVKMSMQF